MRIRNRTVIEHGICLAILSAMPLLLLLPGMLRDDVPVDAQSVLSYVPWEEARPPGMAIDTDAAANLEAARFYPWYVFLSHVEHPSDVLWNPLEFAGQPFFAIWRTRCLSPFTLPFYLGEVNTALRLSIFLKLWVAGFCAFYAARRLGIAPALSMIPATAYQLCGPLLVWSVLPVSDVMPWLPLLFVFAERLALGHYRVWPSGALLLALMLLSGEPEAFAVFVVLAFVYFVLRTISEWRGFAGTGVALLSFAAALVLATGLAAVQLAPFTEFNHFAVESGLPEVRYAPERFDFAAWVLPYVNKNSAEMTPGATIVSHSGLILLLLLPVWLSLRPFAELRTRRRCEAILLPVVGLNVLAHFWMQARGSVPFAGTLNPEHLLAANPFVLGITGALTADEWLRLGAEEIKSTVKRFLVFGTLSIAAAVTAVVWPGGHGGLVPGPWWSALLAVLFGAAAICVLGYTVVHPSVRIMGYTLAALVAIDLVVTFVPRMPSTPSELLYPETPFIALLKKTGGRITGSASLSNWPLAGDNIAQLYGSSGILLKHQRDYKARAEQDPLLLRRSGSRLLLLTQDDIQGSFAPLREMLRIEQVLPTGAILFLDTEAKSRAWMTYEARNVEKYSPGEVTSSAPVLIEQGVPPPPLPPDAQPGTVTINPAETNTRVVVTLDGVSKGILVLADAFFPGWKAKIDGKPARVLAVDVLYRGVEVPEGAKEVVFEYDPPLVKAGLTVSAASLLVLLIAATVLLPSAIRSMNEEGKWVL